MGINRGKQFEEHLKSQFEAVPDTLVLRLYDVTTGFKNQNNPCDFIVFKDGTLNLFELKAIHGASLNFKHDIRENQWEKLYKYSKFPTVNAGVICWFIDYDITLFLDMAWLCYLKEKDYKAFNVNRDIEVIPISIIDGTKKRVFFEYDLKKFLEEISYG